MRSRIVITALALAVSITAPLSAQNVAVAEIGTQQTALELRAADVVAVLQGEKEPEEIFAPTFLQSVPPEQFRILTAQLTQQFGPAQAVESIEPRGATSAKVVLRFKKALGTAELVIEPDNAHLITGLLLQGFVPHNDSAANIRAELEALPGEVGVLFSRLDGTVPPLMAINADNQYAIGSTFKLYVLSALARSIEKGERNWNDVVELDRHSFPSGMMQDWPKGSPVTLHSLAMMMISISDNTATDMLLHELGRDVVEAELIASGHSDPAKTLPFLSTLQMFGLKGSAENLAKYIAADEAGKRAILADFEDDVAGNPNFVDPPRFGSPLAIDTVEWFASGNDLAKIAKRLIAVPDITARDIMTARVALPQTMIDEWQYVGYKGGSEPGVLNLTWILQDEADRWWVLSLSWNNTEAVVDDAQLTQLAQRLLALANQ